MLRDSVSILEGNAFVVSDRRGDIEATGADTFGLFFNDTRFLSRFVLTVNGVRPNVLTIDELDYFKVQFFMAVTTGTIYVDSHLSVVRRRSVADGFNEEITDRQSRPRAGRCRNGPRDRRGLRGSVRGQRQAREEGQAVPRGRGEPSDARLRAGDLPPRDLDYRQGRHGDSRSDARLSRHAGTACELVDHHRGGGARSQRPTRANLATQAGHRRRSAAGRPRQDLRGVGRPGAAAVMLLEVGRAHVPAQHRRPGGAEIPAAGLSWIAAGGRLAVVHGDLRPR